MKVIILTESLRGTAAHHLNYLLECKDIEVVQVVFSKGTKKNKTKFLVKKIRKSIAIGPIGVLNGFRMRKWFGPGVDALLSIKNLDIACAEHKVPFSIVSYTNSEETIDLFKNSGADIGISLGNSYISKKIFTAVPMGMLNIHHEMLPEYQNAQSIIWQLYNKSVNTGYTIHKVSAKIDGGDILLQEVVPIQFKQTLSATIAYTSVDLLKASAAGLIKVLQNFSYYEANAKLQGKGKSYTTPSARQFLRILRNFNELKARHLD
jgi:methionyl-tRNA formyltransferase